MKNGSYDLEGVTWHQHSNKLMVEILDLFHQKVPVIDIGCGHNFYVSVLKYAGYDALGIDQVDLGSKYFVEADVTQPLPDKQQVANVISLEVGEHIPSQLLDGYLDNITRFKGDVLMSWALPGQAGVGHISCRTNEWVIDQMKKRGYEIDLVTTPALRKAVSGCHCSWFEHTILYFKPL